MIPSTQNSSRKQKSKIILQNWIIVDVRVGVVDSFEHEPDPFNVKTDFCENGILRRIAKECRLPAGAETNDSLNLPRLQVLRQKH